MDDTVAPIGYRWDPIEDLPSDYHDLESPELRSLAGLWDEQRDELLEIDAVKDFNKRLLRRSAIETGIIERIYTLDRGITEVLIEQGLRANLIPQHATDKDPELVMRIIRDQHAALEGLFDFVASRRQLSTAYVKELHALLTAHQETTEAVDSLGHRVNIPVLRGEYKQRPNNPLRQDGSIHEYCPPEHVSAEMDRLLSLHAEHQEGNVAPEVEAAWLHHRFTQIHPFQDGNGRVARTLTTLVFIRDGWFPLVVTNDHRAEYIDALEAADACNLAPLVNLFARIEKSAFIQALSTAEDVRRGHELGQAVRAIGDMLRQRRILARRQRERSKEFAASLRDDGEQVLTAVQENLEDEVGPLAPAGRSYRFFVDSEPADGARDHWFRFQVIETAKRFDYYANTSIFHTWVRLGFETEGRSEILLSFHGIGHEYRGLLVATICYFRRDVSEERESSIADVTPLTGEAFQINYKDEEAELRARFRRWLDPALVTGLDLLRRTL